MATLALAGALALALALACGKKPAPATKDDGPPPPGDTQPRDAAASEPTIDAAPAEPLASCTPTAGSNVSLVQIAKIPQQSLVLATSPPFDGRLFVVEQSGRIAIIDHTGKVLPTAFLDLRDDIGGPVLAGGELGLLGLAFDPAYNDNHQFYVYYTAAAAGSGDPYVDVVARYTTSGSDANVADPATATTILAIPDYATNHNGGMLEFGSDHDLYIGTGDGGSEGDPRRNGQNPNALLGKMLRIDVHAPAGGKPYGIPSDNPYANSGGAPEIYMIGLRNPWRWSFDRANGDMWIGEVGAGVTEELDYLPAGHQLGANLGWSEFEGSDCCSTEANHCQAQVPITTCDPTGKVFPQVTRSHATDNWDSIIGGQVYRGPCFPDLTGTYFFTDNGFHGLSEARVGSDGSVTAVDLPGTWPQSPASIHADARGELYLTTTTGLVFHVVAGP